MTSETVRAGRDSARNLQVLLGGAGLMVFGWSWAEFRGPFRLVVDLQLRLLGTYSEPAAAIASALVLIAAVWLALRLVEQVCPSLSKTAADAVDAAVFALASAAALWQAWHLWNEATHMPRLSDRLQVVDLGQVGTAALPVGHVQVIGMPDRERQVLGYITGRTASHGYWEAWVPLIARQPHEADAPVRIVATGRGRDRIAASQAVPDDPQGMLLYDSVDTRTIYEARQQGLDMAERSFTLYPDEGVRFDRLTNAALLGSFIVLFWGFAAYGWVKARRGGEAPTAELIPTPEKDAVPAARPHATSASPPAEPTASVLTRTGSGGAVIALLAGCILWEAFGFFPPRLALLGYAAAATILVVSLLLVWFGQRFEAPTQRATPSPPGLGPLHTLAPPPGAALLCVLRDEPGVSSPSYKRVDLDGARMADLKANRYVVVALWPGPHAVAVNTRLSLTSDTVARFDAAPGDVVAYRLRIPFFGAMRLEPMPDVHGLRTVLARLKPVDPA